MDLHNPCNNWISRSFFCRGDLPLFFLAREFVSVMKQRAKRGLEKPKEIGISRVFSSVFKCAADCKPAIMGGLKKTE